jgi:hypothetical protein
MILGGILRRTRAYAASVAPNLSDRSGELGKRRLPDRQGDHGICRRQFGRDGLQCIEGASRD